MPYFSRCERPEGFVNGIGRQVLAIGGTFKKILSLSTKLYKLRPVLFETDDRVVSANAGELDLTAVVRVANLTNHSSEHCHW